MRKLKNMVGFAMLGDGPKTERSRATNVIMLKRTHSAHRGNPEAVRMSQEKDAPLHLESEWQRLFLKSGHGTCQPSIKPMRSWLRCRTATESRRVCPSSRTKFTLNSLGRLSKVTLSSQRNSPASEGNYPVNSNGLATPSLARLTGPDPTLTYPRLGWQCGSVAQW